jgi:hypothetical protein
MNRIQIFTAALAACALAGATAASASDWKWTVTPYAWATDVGVDGQVHDRQVVDETIPVQSLLEDLDTIAQVRLEAQKGAHGLYLDLFDVNLSDDATTIALPGGAGQATFSPEMGMTILDLGGLWDPQGDQQGFQLLYGVRVLDERATIGAEIVRPDGTTVERDLDVDDTFVDALVGFRYVRRFAGRWSWQMQADASTGGTRSTWSAGPTLGYGFGRTGRYTATVGYRRMEVDFDTHDGVDATMTLSGFVAGLRVAF